MVTNKNAEITYQKQKGETRLSDSFTTGWVISLDGTRIGYRQIGSGPDLVICHGGLRASQHYLRLAAALANDSGDPNHPGAFRVTIPDRRGRGLSGPAGGFYSLDKECQDLAAVLRQTGARWVFGHSGGGLFGLEAALKLPIQRLALYEPAVSIDGSLPLGWLDAYEEAVNREDYATAMAEVIRGLRLNWMSKLPVALLKPIFGLMLRGKERAEIVELLQTGAREARISQSRAANWPEYTHLRAETLLLYGSSSPDYLQQACRILAGTIPHARLIGLTGLDHTAPDEDAPEAVAAELCTFFSSH